MLLLALAACAPPADDPWDRLTAACDLEAIDPWRDPPPIRFRAACAARLEADFGVDAAAWREAEAHTLVLQALWSVAAGRMGRWSELSPGGFAHPELLDALAPWVDGDPPVARLAYAWMASEIDALRPVPRPDPLFLAGYRDGEVLVAEDISSSPADLGAVLFHEARHASGPKHVPCPEGVLPGVTHEQGCDADSSGSFGFQAAYYGLLSERLRDDPFAAAAVEQKAWDTWARVLSP